MQAHTLTHMDLQPKLVQIDEPYWLLRGISAVFLTAATLSLAAISPFPHDAFAKT